MYMAFTDNEVVIYVFMGKHYLRAPAIVIEVYGSLSGKRISVG